MGSAEFLATFIAGWLFMNLYVHPREDGPSEGAQMTHDAFMQLRLQRSHAWVLAGDLNETPSDSAVADLVTAFDGRQEHGVMRHRKMRRQIARLYDLAQCADKVAEGTASSQMVLNLQALRQRCGNLTAGQARAEARTLQNLLHAEEEREKGRRLRDWPTKVSTDTAALSRWLKAKADPAAESLLDETGRHTETAAQAADSIARYWQTFWRDLDIQRPAFHVRNAAVMEGVEVPQQEAVLPLPTGEELGARARKATGAGGADGWHSSELRHLPDGAFELFADLISGWANEGRVPLQMQQSRMVCIPKPGRRVDNSSVGVGDVRPITITSCWWRLFAGTFYNSVQFKQWRRENLSEEIGAITGEDCYLTLAGIMHEFAERKHLLAMDFTKAFDTLDVEVSLQILRRMRWSPGIVALFGSAWGNQQRFVQWKNHCRAVPSALRIAAAAAAAVLRWCDVGYAAAALTKIFFFYSTVDRFISQH
ncbi:unnamed protein product [Effrenium voratum]|nr:unnamed protein product [Effrenium voratum]